jgi:hypothetical protein
MNEDVDIKANADGGDALSLLDSIASSFEKIASKSQHASQEGSAGLSKILEDAAGVAAGMLGVDSAISVVEKGWQLMTAEVDRYLERLAHKAEAFEDLGKIQEKLSLIGSPETIGIVESINKKIGAQAGTGDAIAEALANRGQISEQQVGSLAQLLATLRPSAYGAGGGAGGILSGAEGLMGAFGVDEKQALGTYLQAGRLTFGGKPLIEAAVQGAGDFNESDPTNMLALGAGISQRARDPDATGRFLRQTLPKLVSEANKNYGYQGGSERDFESWLSSSDGKDFIGSMTTGGADSPFEQMMGPMGRDHGGKLRLATSEWLKSFTGEDNKTSQAIRAARQALPSISDPSIYGREQAAAAKLAQSPYEHNLQMQRDFAGARAGMLENDPVGAEKGNLRALFKSTLGDLGSGALEEKLIETQFDAESYGAKSVRDVRSAGAKALRSQLIPAPIDTTSWIGQPTESQAEFEKGNPEAKQTNDLLRELIDKLDGLEINVHAPSSGDHYPASLDVKKTGQ